MATGNNIRITVLLPERVHSRAQTVVVANDVSSAWVIRQAVLHYLSTRTGQPELPLGTDRP